MAMEGDSRHAGLSASSFRDLDSTIDSPPLHAGRSASNVPYNDSSSDFPSLDAGRPTESRSRRSVAKTRGKWVWVKKMDPPSSDTVLVPPFGSSSCSSVAPMAGEVRSTELSSDGRTATTATHSSKDDVADEGEAKLPHVANVFDKAGICAKLAALKAKLENFESEQLALMKRVIEDEKILDLEEKEITNMDDVEVAGEDYFGCTFLCDFMLDVEIPSSDQCRGRKIYPTVLDILNQCCGADINKTVTSATLDIRGRYIEDSIEALMKHLYFWTLKETTVETLIVRVGCKIHGIGKGRLKNMVIKLLDHDKLINFRCSDSGDLIYITLDKSRKDYHSLGWEWVEDVVMPLQGQRLWWRRRRSFSLL